MLPPLSVWFKEKVYRRPERRQKGVLGSVSREPWPPKDMIVHGVDSSLRSKQTFRAPPTVLPVP